MLDVGNADPKDNSLALMHDDPIYLADALWELCQDQITQEKLDRGEFCDAVILASEQARMAMLEELADFFQRAQMDNEESLVRKSIEARPTLRAAQGEKIAGFDAKSLLS